MEEPWGAYPIHLAGCYDSDLKGFLSEIERRGAEAFEKYMEEFVYGVEGRRELIEKIRAKKGDDYFEKLKLKNLLFSEPIRMGL